MLCSVDAGVRHDCELDNDVRQWCWQVCRPEAAPQPPQGVDPLPPSWFEDPPIADRHTPPCPQAVALAAANVPTLALGLYSSEGDNMSDAEVLADLADTVLGLGAEARIPRWIPPRSWQRLFGPGGDMSAY